MKHLFTYGSLMFPEVWGRVVAGSYCSGCATLEGFLRRQVRGETYPAIVQVSPGERVEGVLYFDLSTEDLAILDRFEGNFYLRSPVRVMTDAGEPVIAFTYILREQYRHLLSGKAWDAEEFAKEGIRRFLDDYCGFDR